MASYTWGLLCRRVIIDQPTNAVSYIDVLEAFAVARLPLPAPPMVVGSLWWRTSPDERAIEVRASVESPEGQELATASVLLALQPNHTRGRINIGLGGYEMPSPGRYHVVLEQKQGDTWQGAARLPFEVELTPEVAQPSPRDKQQKAEPVDTPQRASRGRKQRGRKKQRS